MRFAILTDVHFGPEAYFDGKLRKLSHHAGRLTREAIAELDASARPELLVNLGDVIEDASPAADRAAYQEFLAAAAASRAPLLHVAGNHDQVHLGDNDLRELWGHTGELHYLREVGGVRFVVLRTVYRPEVEVQVPETQLPWLDATLAASTLPTIVLVHHPLGEMRLVGNRWFERDPHLCLVANRARVREVIARHPSVVGVFNGHAHWTCFETIGGVPYLTLQSLVENLDEDAPGRPARAYAVVDVGPGQLRFEVLGEERSRFEWRR